MTLNREKLLKMAKEAGFVFRETDFAASTITDFETLERFASLLSAAQEEREPAHVNDELESTKRMFGAACADLGAINEALGLDPDDGGAEPILDAIAELKALSNQAWNEAVEVADKVRLRLSEKYQERLQSGNSEMNGNMDWARLEGAVAVVDALRSLKRPLQAQ